MAAELERVTFNQSRVKTFLHCPKMYDYKYIQLLERKEKVRPLFLGSWVHRALETYYTDGDWKIGHAEYVKLWDKLFDEEKLALRKKGKQLGPPLPEIVERIMRSYVFYYKDDGWQVEAVEQILETETPLKIGNRVWIFKGRLDLLIRDTEGLLWLVDHKTASQIPQSTSFHSMDPQLMMYPWAAERSLGIHISGVIYNYVKSRPPTIPKLNKDGSISRRKVSTDYPTLFRFLKESGYDPNDFREILIPLRKKSNFLRRYKLPRESTVTREIVLDQLATVKRIDETKRFVRNITRDCVRCPYHDLCRSELNGFDTKIMRKTNFDIAEDDYTKDGSIVEADEETDDDE